MKKKIYENSRVGTLAAIAVFIVFVTLVSAFCTPAVSAEPEIYADNDLIGELTSGIITRMVRSAHISGVDEWAATMGGKASDWYFIALARSVPSPDMRAYAEDLLARIVSDEGASAVEKQRKLFALLTCGACGGSFDVIDAGIIDTLGKQGIMSLIWGLQLLNTRAPESQTRAEAVDSLLAAKISGGGWALSGDAANPDVTAMAVCALSRDYGKNEKVTSAVDSALDYLSGVQLDSGCYMSYGTENAETVAQVILALTSVNVDPLNDERFVKNGINLLDALERFVLPDGSFSHTCGGTADEMATSQTLCALVALSRYRSQKKGFFDLSDAPVLELAVPAEPSAEATSPEGTDDGGSPVTRDDDDTLWHRIRVPVCLLILVLTAAAAAILTYLKKINFTTAAVIFGAVLILTAVIFFLNIETVGEYALHDPEPTGDDVKGSATLVMSVADDAATVLGEIKLPDSDPVAVNITDGTTAYDVLCFYCRRNGIPLAVSGAGKSIYVCSVGGIGEFDAGDTSGWIYTVNGKRPAVSAGEYVLSDGDTVTWTFVRYVPEY